MSDAFNGKVSEWASHFQGNFPPTSFNTVQNLGKERPNKIEYLHVFYNGKSIYKLIGDLRDEAYNLTCRWSTKV